jgi:hypothetical protein
MENLLKFSGTFTINITSQQQRVLNYIKSKAKPPQQRTIETLENFYINGNTSDYQLQRIIVKFVNTIKSDINLLSLFNSTCFPTCTIIAYPSISPSYSSVVANSKASYVINLERRLEELLFENAELKERLELANAFKVQF